MILKLTFFIIEDTAIEGVEGILNYTELMKLHYKTHYRKYLRKYRNSSKWILLNIELTYMKLICKMN